MIFCFTLGVLLGCSEQKQADNGRVSEQLLIYHLRLAETWPANMPILGEVTRNMARIAATMSNGRLRIKVDSRDVHKAPLGVFDLVSSGQYDMGHSTSYYYKGKVPATLYFTTMPFGMTSVEQYAWFYHGGGMELLQEVYAQHEIIAFLGGNTSNQMGGWFKKEINSVSDLQGLKIRIPGFAGEIMAKIGAKPVNIPAGELYTALERNTIDALEWVGPAFDLKMGFHKLARYYYTGWHEPGPEVLFMVNTHVWQRLPADLQAILRAAMRVSAYNMYIQSYHKNAEGLARIKTEYPTIEVRTFPSDVMYALKNANQQLLDDKAAKDPLAQRILESQSNYLQQVRGWTKISDQAYLNSLIVSH